MLCPQREGGGWGVDATWGADMWRPTVASCSLDANDTVVLAHPWTVTNQTSIVQYQDYCQLPYQALASVGPLASQTTPPHTVTYLAQTLFLSPRPRPRFPLLPHRLPSPPRHSAPVSCNPSCRLEIHPNSRGQQDRLRPPRQSSTSSNSSSSVLPPLPAIPS